MPSNTNSKNFSEQNLSGRSFKGMDLSNADFSDCDLRGVDFTGANLTQAQFCRARMGRRLRATMMLTGLQFIFSVASAMLLALSIAFLGVATEDTINHLLNDGVSRTDAIFLSACFCLIITIINSWMVILSKNIANYQFGIWIIIIVTTTATIIGTEAEAVIGAAAKVAVVKAVAGFGAGVMAGIIAICVITAGIFAVLSIGTSTIASAVLLSVAGVAGGSVTVFASGTRSVSLIIAIAVTVICIFFICTYLSRKAINTEEIWLFNLRHLALKLPSLFTTQFAYADLSYADFSDANVHHVRFNLVRNFQGSLWHRAQNLHLAITDKTPLAPRKVRDLLAQAELGSERDFSKLDLHGLDFARLNLQGINFNLSDLSHANLTGCDLRNANLSACQLFGAKLDRCQLTGAIIENWNIDKHTSLAEIECNFVWLRTDEKERQPPDKFFQKGDFSKLYQEVAGTVDFIAHSFTELAALLAAIDAIKTRYGDEYMSLQAIESKDESVVVKTVKSVKVERSVLFQQVLSEAENAIKILQMHSDKIAAILKEKKQDYDKLLNVIASAQFAKSFIQNLYIGDNMHFDQSRKIEGNTISNSAVNLGDHSTVTCTVQTLPAEDTLKTLLEQLQALINNSHLAENDKKSLITETNQLAHASQQTGPEKENIARKTLRYFKGFVEDFKDVPDTAKTFGETLAKIAIALGVTGLF